MLWRTREELQADATVIQRLMAMGKEFLIDKLKRPTAEDLMVDEDVQALRKIKPRIAYLLLAINLGVYAAGIVAGLGPGGSDAQQDYFLALAKIDSGIEAGEYYRQIFTSLQVLIFHHTMICSSLIAPAISDPTAYLSAACTCSSVDCFVLTCG